MRRVSGYQTEVRKVVATESARKNKRIMPLSPRPGSKYTVIFWYR